MALRSKASRVRHLQHLQHPHPQTIREALIKAEKEDVEGRTKYIIESTNNFLDILSDILTEAVNTQKYKKQNRAKTKTKQNKR